MHAICFITAYLIATCTALSSASDPIVDLGYATYRGLLNETLSTREFYGIRFGQPPTGRLRWKAPQPMSSLRNSSSVILNATQPGPICMQGYPYWTNPNAGTPQGSEDCLILNVIGPANTTNSSNLPVLVIVPGGGYTMGDAGSGDVHALLNHTGNAFIAVALQYRLGAYGFLGSDAFANEGGDANVGLLDQRLGLEWVQRYISLFGGDPAKVTLTGGSAGGGSITDQLIMYGGRADPPFRAAMPEFPWWQQMLRKEQLNQQYQYLLESTNCTSMACMRGLSEGTLAAATQATYVQAYSEGAYGYGNFYYGPYVDGSVIRDLPSREFRAGHFSKVPLWLDHAKYEGYTFSNQSLTNVEDETQDLKIQFPSADQQFIDKVYELYPRESFNATFWQRQTWFGDFSINCPTYYVASSASSYDVPVYKMLFAAGSQTHGASGAFIADPSTLPFGNPGYNETLASIMKDWWASFAIYLDPNARRWSTVERPSWPLYNESAEFQVMSINYTQSGAVSDLYFDNSEQCKFFEENGEVVQN
ncbi:alpha/beta-hydrolase [Lophiostoma macrostomum CBS 122681]|uniref:Carboxylic ester hydrolase n=1 Tax=Lophiostoma macrostomum CBS 122681 TaxID=1314788 RepID=A0A6A6TPJ6_9PLEO|nr:alpha/beta-hydrolase [Lophiostoma macrostomum CBS 122681]